MKFVFVLFAVSTLSSDLISATYYNQNGGNTYRVRRQGVKGQSAGQYIQQEKTYDGGAALAGTRQQARPLPSRPRARQQQAQEEQYDYNQVSGGGAADAEPPSYGGVAGTPGQDFPAYKQIPQTSFSCANVPYPEYGMYADEETQCQAYHVCFQGRKESFLCGVGTVFNQAILACDYWHSVECSRTKEFYSSNEELGKASPEPGQGGAQGGAQSQWQQPKPARQQYQPQQQPARQQYQPRPQAQQPQYQQGQPQYQQQQPQGQYQQGQQQQQYKPKPQYKPRPQQPQYGPSQASAGAYAGAQAQAQYKQPKPQYPSKSPRPIQPVQPVQPAAEYEEAEEVYETQPQAPAQGRKQPRPQAPAPRPQYQPQAQPQYQAPAPKPQRPQVGIKAQVSYGGQQVSAQVGVAEAPECSGAPGAPGSDGCAQAPAPSAGVDYAEEEQAAVRAPQLVAPAPRPRPQVPLAVAPAPQPRGPAPQVKSKYRAGGASQGNQLSPSYRSKALSQAQPGEDYQQEDYSQPQQQPQQFGGQADTQQKLNY